MADVTSLLLTLITWSVTKDAMVVMVTGTKRVCQSKYNSMLDNKTTDQWLIRQIDLRNSSAKLECAARCITERSCVTYMVNHITGVCRMYGARITLFNKMVASYGFKSYDTCRAWNVYGNICAKNSDCAMANSKCIDYTCQCSEGWSYSPNELVCVRECAYYGSEFSEFPHSYIAANNKADFYGQQYLSARACSDACIAATNFTCRTFELDFVSGSCKLADVTVYMVPADEFITIPDVNVYFYQRHCGFSG